MYDAVIYCSYLAIGLIQKADGKINGSIFMILHAL